jgi:hypothetical protein
LLESQISVVTIGYVDVPGDRDPIRLITSTYTNAAIDELLNLLVLINDDGFWHSRDYSLGWVSSQWARTFAAADMGLRISGCRYPNAAQF